MESNNNKSGRVVAKKKQKKQNRKNFVVSLLRRGSFYWKARAEALTNARVARGQYRCAMCGELFGPKEVDIDHIEPVIDPRTGFTTFDDYINKLFCDADGFQILCRAACHSSKTMIEDQMREHFKTGKEEIPDFKHKKTIDKLEEE